MIQPPACPLLPRGVYRAPVLGVNRMVVLIAVTEAHQVAEEVECPNDPEELEMATADLWRLLDVADPEHSRRRKG